MSMPPLYGFVYADRLLASLGVGWRHETTPGPSPRLTPRLTALLEHRPRVACVADKLDVFFFKFHKCD